MLGVRDSITFKKTVEFIWCILFENASFVLHVQVCLLSWAKTEATNPAKPETQTNQLHTIQTTHEANLNSIN